MPRLLCFTTDKYASQSNFIFILFLKNLLFKRTLMTTELKFDPSLIYMEYGHFCFLTFFHKQNITCTYPELFYLLNMYVIGKCILYMY